MTQALKQLHRISCLIGEDKPLYQHVLEGDDTVLWIDAGIASTPRQEMMPYWHNHAGSSAMEKKQLLLVTHADVDHFGGCGALQKWLPRLTTMAHQADIAWISNMERIVAERYAMHAEDGAALSAERIAQLQERSGGGAPIDIALSGGETIRLGSAGDWQLLSTPGHTPGHLALWEERSKTAIIGDAVLGRGLYNTAGRLVAPPPYYDCGDYEGTIELLRGLELDIVYSSHFPVMDRGEFQCFLDESLDMMRQLDHALLLLPKERKYTLSELCREAGSRIGCWPEQAWSGLCDPVSAHLKAFIRAGKAAVSLDAGQRLYSFH
ncbi:MBL fold metallo-hydrolase [Paenibacillus pasadenensis]|uniref:MBL fold metallo-hydrolase n=1 Tax=Paenibacillus pasadenensis TaxID=217090 RepID=UPI00203C32D1|nr:MBL fold metallo-hydrolase [Paenibacillus pasadenensis]MCM3748764.1 MBL fold metallo-hydrolase [Paenibacillus pasadenensis]